MFYNANTRDVYQDKHAHFNLPPMKDRVRCEWADDGEPDPWYAGQCAMAMSVLYCMATCWFLKMRQMVCADSFTFRKTANSFAGGY